MSYDDFFEDNNKVDPEPERKSNGNSEQTTTVNGGNDESKYSEEFHSGNVPLPTYSNAENGETTENVGDNTKPKKTLGILSMIFGIVSAQCINPWLAFIGLPCGIVAIILASIQYKKGKNGFAVAGLVTGICGTALGIVLLAVYMFIFLNIIGDFEYDGFYSIIKFIVFR